MPSRAAQNTSRRCKQPSIFHTLRLTLTLSHTYTQSLPRMLTLWFASTMPDMCRNKGVTDEIHKTIQKIGSGASAIPAHVWFTCMPQLVSLHSSHSTLITTHSSLSSLLFLLLAFYPSLSLHTPPQVSRAQHPDSSTAQLVRAILIKIMLIYPSQGIWHIAGMHNPLISRREGRKKSGERFYGPTELLSITN